MFEGTQIDLHMHSRFSDGTDWPEELLDRVRAAGLKVFSLTDHDSCAGSIRMRDLVKESGDLSFICGTEIGCRDDYGKYHILGYHYDPEHESIKQLIRQAHNNRMIKFQGRIDGLREKFGFVFGKDEVEALRALDNPGKPHIANLMIKKGYVSDRKEGIEKYLNHVHVKAPYIRPEEAILAIRAAGGIPVLAHPWFGNGSQKLSAAELEERVKRLRALGLMGLECFYSTYSPGQREEILALAGRYEMLITAGSDYHGGNKPIALGKTGFPEGGQMPEKMREFLAACNVLA